MVSGRRPGTPAGTPSSLWSRGNPVPGARTTVAPTLAWPLLSRHRRSEGPLPLVGPLGLGVWEP